MSNQFIPIERDQPVVIPVQEWLAEDHLARFLVEIVESLDVTPLEAAYSGGGSAPYPPKMMLALLFYGYATGIRHSESRLLTLPAGRASWYGLLPAIPPSSELPLHVTERANRFPSDACRASSN